MKKLDSLCMLVHTCDKYNFCWEGWYLSFLKNWNNEKIKVFFVNEEKNIFYENIKQIKTGFGEWSDRLIFALNKINYENILYIQEDMWFNKKIDINSYFFDFIEYEMDALRLLNGVYGNSRHYQFEDNVYNNKYLKFHKNSQYLISHQPSIWKKNFFLENLEIGENPWNNEINGTNRIIRNKKKHSIYSVIGLEEWYNHVVRKGNLTNNGKKILKKLKEN